MTKIEMDVNDIKRAMKNWADKDHPAPEEKSIDSLRLVYRHILKDRTVPVSSTDNIAVSVGAIIEGGVSISWLSSNPPTRCGEIVCDNSGKMSASIFIYGGESDSESIVDNDKISDKNIEKAVNAVTKLFKGRWYSDR